MKVETFKISAEQSSIEWTGRKVTGAHNGTINIKQGAVTLEDGKLTGGHFIIDATSIKILDVTDPATNAQFAGHLTSDDFFATEQFPEAFFTITGVNGHRIHGDLTIKGITHPVAFDGAVSVDGETVTAKGRIVIDRTLYNMKFRSGNFFQNLGDTLIYNDFDLDITIKACAAASCVLS